MSPPHRNEEPLMNGGSVHPVFRAVFERLRPERLVKLTVEAVKRYSPSLAEEPATELFEQALARGGIDVTRQQVCDGVSHGGEPGDQDPPGPPKRANLLAHIGPRPSAVTFVGHVDTIALRHDEEHKVRTEGDLLYGLGAADMKAGCAAMVEAALALIEARVPLRRGLTLALVVGEEEVGDGSEALAETLESPISVVGEPTNLLPCTHHFGYLEYRLAARGRRAHAALPEIGDNAIHTMLAWIPEILRGARRLPESSRVAVSLREIRGGTGHFVIADQCEALLDVHMPPDLDGGLFAEVIETARRALPPGEGAHASFEELFWAPGYSTHPTDPRLAPLALAYRAVDLPWQPAAFRSHSDAPILHGAGTLPVICGPGRLEVAHTRLEHVSMSQVREAAKLYAAMMCAACVL